MKLYWLLFGTATFIASWFTHDVNLTVLGCYAFIMYKLEDIKEKL